MLTNILRWIERLLIVVGIAALVYSAWFVVDGAVSQRLARQALDVATHVNAPPTHSGNAPIEPKAPRIAIQEGDGVGRISIPRVNLTAVVLEGSDSRTLRRGPGHLRRTALPGQRGNSVIAGHRDSFFRPLRDVRAGDDIFVDTPRERVHYRITSLRVVGSRDVSVLAPTLTPTLTLITCYPFLVFGNAPDRFVVRAARVDDAPALVTAPSPRAVDTTPPVATSGIRPSAPRRRIAVDDETLVRDAVDRFRVTYNGRLMQRDRVDRADQLLKFDTCALHIDGDEATAACLAATPQSDDGSPSYWTLTLQRGDGAWAIRSVVHP